jgi:Ner family transcriptional regulator
MFNDSNITFYSQPERKVKTMSNQPPKNPAQEDWHAADVIAALHKQGKSLASIAREHGLTNSSVLSSAFARSYPLNEKRIADAVGVPVQEIWPSRWYPDGSKKQRGYRAGRGSVGCNGNGNMQSSQDKQAA